MILSSEPGRPSRSPWLTVPISSLPQRIEDEPCNQFGVKVGGFLGHAIIRLRHIANLADARGIEQQGHLRLSISHRLHRLARITSIAYVRPCRQIGSVQPEHFL